MARVAGHLIRLERGWGAFAPTKSFNRRTVTLQAFIDESEDNSTFAIAGYLATAENWAKFSNDWEGLLPWGSRDKRGNLRFKMSEMSEYDRGTKFPAFYRIIEKHLKIAFSVSLFKLDIERAKSRILVNGISPSWDSINLEDIDKTYVLLLIMIFYLILDKRPVWEEIVGSKEPVDFYFDDKSEKKFVYRQWELFNSYMPPDLRKRCGANPRFENEVDFMPLQAADLWAWWVRRKHTQALIAGQSVLGDFEDLLETNGKSPMKQHLFISEDMIARIYYDLVRKNTPDVSQVWDTKWTRSAYPFGPPTILSQPPQVIYQSDQPQAGGRTR